jgi:hypothetical protein
VPDEKPDVLSPSELRENALSRWDSEGGAGPDGPQAEKISTEARFEIPDLTNAELVQLRIRVIALENLVIALLAQAPDRQLEIAREMASYIAPRPEFTHHPLTVRAAVHMVDLVDRAGRFRP